MISTTRQLDKINRLQVARSSLNDNHLAMDDVVGHILRYLESWRQITHYVGLARIRKFDMHDEDQFLDLKGIIVQELETILASGECASPTKEDVHSMMNNAPSLRYLSQLNEGALRNLETQWHIIYIHWHATLGQLKAKHKELDSHPSRPGFLHGKLSW